MKKITHMLLVGLCGSIFAMYSGEGIASHSKGYCHNGVCHHHYYNKHYKKYPHSYKYKNYHKKYYKHRYY